MGIENIVETNLLEGLCNAVVYYYSTIPEPVKRMGKTALILGGIFYIGYTYFNDAYKNQQK